MATDKSLAGMKNNQLIVALGNPGKKYLLTPHNIGWMVADALAHSLKLSWKTQKKLSSDTVFFLERSFFLAKPLTYMNLSGLAVKALLNYYRIDLAHLLVIQDDTDLPFLSLRFQKNRGTAGHNGIRSIHEELGCQDYARMRIGMRAMPTADNSTLPSSETAITRRNVLKPFSKKEQELLPSFLNKAIEALLYFVEEGFEKTANRYNN